MSLKDTNTDSECLESLGMPHTNICPTQVFVLRLGERGRPEEALVGGSG